MYRIPGNDGAVLKPADSVSQMIRRANTQRGVSLLKMTTMFERGSTWSTILSFHRQRISRERGTSVQVLRRRARLIFVKQRDIKRFARHPLDAHRWPQHRHRPKAAAREAPCRPKRPPVRKREGYFSRMYSHLSRAVPGGAWERSRRWPLHTNHIVAAFSRLSHSVPLREPTRIMLTAPFDLDSNRRRTQHTPRTMTADAPLTATATELAAEVSAHVTWETMTISTQSLGGECSSVSSMTITAALGPKAQSSTV